MPEEAMIVRFSGDVKSAVAGVKEVSLSLKEQQAILQKLKIEYAYLDAAQRKSAFGKTIAADIKIASAEVANLKTQSNGLGSSLSKGIGPLRTLANILPGIGIAGLFTAAFSGIDMLFSKVGKTSEEVEKLNKKINELIKSTSEIGAVASGGTSGDIALVQSLSTAVLDQTLSYEKRNRALGQLKDINKEYFGDLTLETAALGGLKIAVEEYTNAIIAVAVVKAFSDEIGKVGVELSKQISAYNEAGKEVDKYSKELDKATKAAKLHTYENNRGVIVTEGEYSKAVDKATVALSNSEVKMRSIGSATSKLADQMSKLKTAIQGAVNESLSFKDLTPDKPDKITISPKKIIIKPIPIGGINIEFPPEDAKLSATEFGDMFGKELSDYFNQPGEKFDFSLVLAMRPKIKTDAEKLADEFTAVFATTLGSGLLDSISAVGEGLGNVLSGKEFGKGLFEAIGGLIQNLGKAIIQFGVIKKFVDSLLLKPFFVSGFAAIGVGLAAIAIGAAIKNLGGKSTPGRAAGGPVGAGQSYVVGERGSEIFVPSQSGRIIPNNNISGLGSANPVIIFNGNLGIHGNELRLLLSRTDKYQSRNV